MSTLKVNTIQDTSAGSSSTPAQIKNGRVKAWCRYHTSGTTGIDDSYGVSSVSDNGATYSYVNFSTSFSNANYAVCCNAQEDSGGGARFAMPYTTAVDKVQIETRDHGNNTMDATIITVLVCGDM